MNQSSTSKSTEVSALIRAHSRDSVGLKYVYPVVSRRAGGVSIGINLNVNSACNWQCVYCQVPNLKRGKPDPVDVDLLERELRGFLDEIVYGDFMEKYVLPASRVIKDIAFSGNGEPTAAVEFPQVVERLKTIKADYPQLKNVPVRVITNGSQMGKAAVIDAISALSKIKGEIWFKVDTADENDQQRINGVKYPASVVLKRFASCASVCPTWIQTCLFYWDDQPPAPEEIQRYVDFCKQAKELGAQGVFLYTIARETMQRSADHVTPMDKETMSEIAGRVQSIGLPVQVNA